jgi:hypothetical protein
VDLFRLRPIGVRVCGSTLAVVSDRFLKQVPALLKDFRFTMVDGWLSVLWWGGASRIQPTHNSKAPGYNPWKLYEVMSWFLKPLLFTNATCAATLCRDGKLRCFSHMQQDWFYGLKTEHLKGHHPPDAREIPTSDMLLANGGTPEDNESEPAGVEAGRKMPKSSTLGAKGTQKTHHAAAAYVYEEEEVAGSNPGGSKEEGSAESSKERGATGAATLGTTAESSTVAQDAMEVGLRVALHDAYWSALYREPRTCDFASSSSNRCWCLWCGPSLGDDGYGGAGRWGAGGDDR